jgi:hypothetical protein
MKLALLAGLGVVVMHAVHLVIGNRIASRALLEEQAQLGRRVARLVAEQSGDALLVDDLMTLYGLVRSAVASPDDVSYCFVVRGGRVVASSFDGPTPEALVRLRSDEDVAPVLVTLDGAAVLDIAEPILGGNLGQIRLGLGMKAPAALRRELAGVRERGIARE